MTHYQDISIALAGVCQSASLVQQFAHKGIADRDTFKHSLESLFITQPDSTLDVFQGNLSHLKQGLETALAQFGGAKGKLDTEIGRYWIGVLALSQKLDKNPQAKANLAQRLQQLERQLSLYDNDILHEQMIANIASIYSDIISPLGSRIHVLGVHNYLTRPDIQNRVRASLLAGIRAGILWQQVGGSRWQFFFSRKKILNATQYLYSQL
ncbi:high frequency lysogenization protein HflD [Actinobacillus indolicus]|uniref:High frequency lysogenization protein HflD homolog n=1 Tax=Actinobacillus indolicus TaxID=51049 RepID=A0A4P7CH00_9PAST|nr:high frequency lysogenization protein HflD [Actinobacillus indolicus]QBQ62862.1 high frequency lysogenization protein HflD [Actinobacillus indolicus]